MTKNQIKEALRAQGFNPRYSGKNKCFFIHKYPEGNLLMDIEQSGFIVLVQS